MKICPVCAEAIQEAADLGRHCGRGPASAGAPAARWLTRQRMVLLVILAVFALAVLTRDGERVSSAPRAPLTLADDVQHVPAASWTAVPLALPYSGTLDVSVDVVHGNGLDIFVTTADSLDVLKEGRWATVPTYSPFSATKTKTLRRTAPMFEGRYYLVVRDTTNGRSSAASEVTIRATLRPSQPAAVR